MNVNGKYYQTVWMEGQHVLMIHQNKLPWSFEIHTCTTYQQTCDAIRTMIVRGAGAIGAAAGFAMAQAFLQTDDANPENIVNAKRLIEATRPTARNLFYAVEKVFAAGLVSVENAVAEARMVAQKDIEDSRNIGLFGSQLFGAHTRVLTHCNAGWLAFVDYGTALSPIYTARDQDKKVFVYVDETRPRGQGARLTAWELQNEQIDHQIIPDTAAATLMAEGKVDLIITGADRIACNGDTANKIGTLDRAILAAYYKIPFYIAAPTSTIDQQCDTGKDIEIEHRSEDEVLFQEGPDAEGNLRRIRVASEGSTAFNPAFDITPSKLITGIITEKGILKAQGKIIRPMMKKLYKNT